MSNRHSSIWDREEALSLLLSLVKKGLSVDACVRKMNNCGYDVNRNMLIGKVNRMNKSKLIDYSFNSASGKNAHVARAKRMKEKRQRVINRKKPSNSGNATAKLGWWASKKPNKEKEAWRSTFKDLDMYDEDKLKTIDQCADDQCTWPIAEDKEGLHLFCPRKRSGNRSTYCEFHKAASTEVGIRSVEKYRVEGHRPSDKLSRACGSVYRPGVPAKALG